VVSATDEAGRVSTSSNLNFRVYPEATGVVVEDTGYKSPYENLTISNANSFDADTVKVSEYKLTNSSGVALKLSATADENVSSFTRRNKTAYSYTKWQKTRYVRLNDDTYVVGVIGQSGNDGLPSAARMCGELDQNVNPVTKIEYKSSNSWISASHVYESGNVLSVRDQNLIPADTASVYSMTAKSISATKKYFAGFKSSHSDITDGTAIERYNANTQVFAVPIDSSSYGSSDVQAALKTMLDPLGQSLSWSSQGSQSETVGRGFMAGRSLIAGPYGHTWTTYGRDLTARCPNIGETPFGTVYGRTSCDEFSYPVFVWPVDFDNHEASFNITLPISHKISFTQQLNTYSTGITGFNKMYLEGSAWTARAYIWDRTDWRATLKDGSIVNLNSDFGLSLGNNKFYSPPYTDNTGVSNEGTNIELTNSTDFTLPGVSVDASCAVETSRANVKSFTHGWEYVRQAPLDVPSWGSEVVTENYYSSTYVMKVTDINGTEFTKTNGYYIIPAGAVAYVSKWIIVPDTGPMVASACDTNSELTNCSESYKVDINRQFYISYLVNASNGTESGYHSNSSVLATSKETTFISR